jgi:hypothetical protein
MGREVSNVEEVAIAIVRGERNQEQETTGRKCGPTLTIQQPRPRNKARQA